MSTFGMNSASNTNPNKSTEVYVCEFIVVLFETKWTFFLIIVIGVCVYMYRLYHLQLMVYQVFVSVQKQIILLLLLGITRFVLFIKKQFDWIYYLFLYNF